MEWLFILGLSAALAALFGRVRTLEKRLTGLEAGHALRAPSPIEEPEPFAEPVSDQAFYEITSVQSEALVTDIAAPAPPIAEEPESSARQPFRIDLEDVFGRRLPIWAGGVTLAVAGVFLVRYSIERGLITPLLRVIMAFVFGFGLLAGAEAAYRFRMAVADPRVGQALAGAGLATLYAAFYLAGTQYGLIGQTLAFLGLAAVTAGAIALSYRFGLPSAVLGLVGGFAAPALVGGEAANLPLLALYLGLVTTGLVLTGRRQQRAWLGIAALIGGLGWGAVLLAAGRFGTAEVIALGFYFIVLGAVLPALTDAPRFARLLRLAAALAASVQLALLVDAGGYSPLTWGLYLLLGAALAAVGWRRAELREASALAALVAVVLLAQWDSASGAAFAAVAAGIAAVFALVPLLLVRRGGDRPSDRWQLVGTTAGVVAVAYLTFGQPERDAIEAVLALGTAGLASIPLAAAWLVRLREDAKPLALFAATGAALAFAALLMVTPGWLAPVAAAAVGGVLFAAFRTREDEALRTVLAGAAVASGMTLAAGARFEAETLRLFGQGGDGFNALGGLRWLAVAALTAVLAWREPHAPRRRLAEAGAVILAYGAAAQLLPAGTLAWSAALLAIALHRALPARSAALLTALAIAGGWVLEPLGIWLAEGAASLTGDPVLASELPSPVRIALHLLPAAVALAIARLPLGTIRAARIDTLALAVPLAVVAAHVLFKQLFAIDGPARFVAAGLAERTVWEALLLAAAMTATRFLPHAQGIGRALAAAALAHFALYTGLLHNPLWAEQALGSLPLLNLALAAYTIAGAAALLLRRAVSPRAAALLDGAVMLLASLAALTLLRQAFAGSVPAGVPLGQTEDLLRSLAGIVLALAFLWLGSRRQERSWRLGSLAIMLVAVAKVFLVDAAGLDGLLRVASFMALGFSLIGIGWVYARQLRTRPAAG